MELYFKNKLVRKNDSDFLCNVCNSKLIIKKSRKKRTHIISCSNDNCSSKKNYKDKWRAFYDIDIYDKKILNYNNSHKNTIGPFHLGYWINKGYSEEDAKKKLKENQSTSAQLNKGRKMNKPVGKIEYWLDKCDNDLEIATQKLNEYLDKVIITRIGHWINKGYSEEDAKKKISEHQKNVSKNVNYNKILQPTKIEYYINKGFSESESKEKLKERQSTFTLQKCINKYGNIDGVDVWTKRQEKWQKTLKSKSKDEIELINKKKGVTKEQMISKYGLEKTIDILKKRCFHFKGYSNISKELFEKIEKIINKKCFYAENEYCIKNENKIMFADFLCENKIIEFNGTVFHADPRIFKETDRPNPFNKLTSKMIWENDKKRLEILKQNYDILIIWEIDYLNDKEKIVKECLNFLNETNN
jgi:hypothetical protein